MTITIEPANAKHGLYGYCVYLQDGDKLPRTWVASFHGDHNDDRCGFPSNEKARESAEIFCKAMCAEHDGLEIAE